MHPFKYWEDGYRVYGYGDGVLHGGYQALVASLAADPTIEPNAPVRRMELDDNGVRVSTADTVFEADKVLVTVPLGVLESGDLVFGPPLPPAEQRALGRLGFGSLNKIALHYPERFWPAEQYVVVYLCRETDGHPTVVIGMWKSHDKPILVLLLGASLGRALESWSDQQVHDYWTTVVRDIFCPDAPMPRCPDAPMPRCPDAPMPRCPDAPMPRCPGTPAYFAHGMVIGRLRPRLLRPHRCGRLPVRSRHPRRAGWGSFRLLFVYPRRGRRRCRSEKVIAKVTGSVRTSAL
ncbi:FAD-dependent oxidoreductase [Nocardia sp. NBC_01388]|uniref:FAD-dependent oxidoreductase n=1 Tax=Nocardia sp. NBC_01388 TaxID=2903596 RepID=UPI003253C0AB